GPAPWGGGSSTVSAADASGAGSTFPQEAGPSADNPQPASGVPQQASGVPPWGITDSPSAPAEGTVQADAEPTAPGPLSDARAAPPPAGGPGTRETGRPQGPSALGPPRWGGSAPPPPPGRHQRDPPAHGPAPRRRRFPSFPAGPRNRQSPARSAGHRGPGLT